MLFPTAAFPICEERGVEVADVVDGKEEAKLSIVDKQDEADYIHYCGHDTNPPTPCKRIRIK